MEKSRLEMLEETLKARPENAFVRYGLAMEFKNAGRDQEAWQQFDLLLRNHPDYWAAYYQAGTLLAKMGRRDEARKIMSKGLVVTGQQKNLHAQTELQAALGELED